MTAPEPLASIKHLRAAGLCNRGARPWFAEQGLSWDRFVSPGIPASDLEATGNPYALRVAALARQESA